MHASSQNRKPWALAEGAGIRRLARKLEVRAVGLVPEYFTLSEGLRAGLVVGVPLAGALISGQGVLGWSIFAAFWTCLCVGPGSERNRRRLLAHFVVLGAAFAFAGSWLAGWGNAVVMVAGPALVFLAILIPARIPGSNLLATLLGVVAVVAVGFPLPAHQALAEALAFLLGAGWAFGIIHGVWRIDPRAPLDLAARAVVARLTDMAADLVATGTGPHRDAQWHIAHGEHRRAVRLALERLAALQAIYADEPPAVMAPYLRAQDAAETVFSALIALDHAFIVQSGPARERVSAARIIHLALAAWHAASDPVTAKAARLDLWIARLGTRRARMRDATVAGCLSALEQALGGVAGEAVLPSPAPQRAVPFHAALRQALRQATGVLMVYFAAQLFHLGYPYWGSMAVVVVLQKGTRITWMRCVERIFGSLLGGVTAAAVLGTGYPMPVLAALCVVLSALAIALRGVNYTVFVIFLTVLFVTVTAMLHPGAGIASARVADNTIGSLVALIAVLSVWPERRGDLRHNIAAALRANQAYLDAVDAHAPLATIQQARRAAGLTSIEVEMSLHDLGRIFQRWRHRSPEDVAALKELRMVAGEAAAVWHASLSLPK
jgi:hypothetical protein